jgi:glycosyltransferase involved in cell wall biosynthesis
VSGKVKLYETIDKFVLRHFDLVIGVSEEIKKRLIELGLNQQKTMTLHNSLDFSAYSLDVDEGLFRRELGLRKGEVLIGSVGRLSKEKGIEYFLLMAKKILELENKKSVKFVVVGDGPDKESLLRRKTHLGLDGHVAFVGYRTDLNNIYKAIDIFILPSLSEGVPISLLEAAYFAKPVIATKVGGIPELFQGKAVLVPPGNVNELTDETLMLIGDEGKAKRYGIEIKRYVQSRCDPQKWACMLENMYINLMRP